MYTLKKTGMKWLKCVHLFTAACWVGGACSLFLLGFIETESMPEGSLFGINTASRTIDIWIVSMIGATGCLVTGLLYGVFTVWGFFRQAWLRWKWFLTVSAILSGIFFLGVWEVALLDLSREIGQAAARSDVYLAIKEKHRLLSSIQIAVLLGMVVLSVFKPVGKKTVQK